ncbi:unnamed protein product, partial [Closterium sp. NIES-53]
AGPGESGRPRTCSRSGTKYGLGRVAPPEPVGTAPVRSAAAPAPAAPPAPTAPAPAPSDGPASAVSPAPTPLAAPTPVAPAAPVKCRSVNFDTRLAIVANFGDPSLGRHVRLKAKSV